MTLPRVGIGSDVHALADGVPFWVSANGVVLTSGREGALPLVYVREVRDEQGVQVWP